MSFFHGGIGTALATGHHLQVKFSTAPLPSISTWSLSVMIMSDRSNLALLIRVAK